MSENRCYQTFGPTKAIQIKTYLFYQDAYTFEQVFYEGFFYIILYKSPFCLQFKQNSGPFTAKQLNLYNIVGGIMGKCVSMTSDTVELRKTDYNSFNPYQTKITESDYSFLRPPPNIHDGKNNLAEEKKNHSRPLSKQDYYKTNPDLKEEQEKAFKRMDKQHLDLFPNSLASQLEKDDQLLNAYNTKSKIIKVSKKKPQKVQKGKTEKSEDLQVIEDLGKNEVIYGRLINEKIYSVISLQHDDVDMQFILPKCRAGPLMVPYLDYDKYSPQSI